MLTVLDVQKHTNMNFFEKLKSIFCPYRICTEVKSKDDISVLYIKYHLCRGKINFDKLYPLTIGCPKTILCNKNISLQNTFFKHFESNTFKIKMMQNFVISVLDKIDAEINIGYIDTKAEYPKFINEILNRTSQLTIISDMPRFYENVCKKISGKNISVSNSTDILKNCDIIISVSPIEKFLDLKNNSVIFSYEKSTVNIKNTVFSNYELPGIFSEIKPDCISREYFLSAIYSLCGIKKLEYLIPKTCSDGIKYYSADYISSIYKNKSDNI